MKTYKLDAQKRNTVGRKVKSLRAAGQVPATVYGKNIQSTSVSVAADAFEKVFSEAGETGLVELSIGGDLPAGRQDVRPVLIHTVQTEPVYGKLLHVEFYQVDLKEKVKANVPVELAGDAPAVVNKVGVLLTITDEVEVEALPTDLPEKISVDVSRLAEVNQEIKVSDLVAPKGVTILTTADQSIVRVGSLISKEAEAQAAEEAAQAAAAAAAAAPAEGAAPAGGPAEAAPATEAAKPESPKKE